MSVLYENNNVTVDRTVGEETVVYLRPGDNIILNFDVSDASSLDFVNGDVVIKFPDSGRITLAHYADIQLSDFEPVSISDASRKYSREQFEQEVKSKVSINTNDSNFLVLFRDIGTVKTNEDGKEYGSSSEILNDDKSEAKPAGDGDTEGPEELDTLVSTASQFQLKTLNFYTELSSDIPIRYTTVYSNKDKDDDVGVNTTPVLTISPTVVLLYGTKYDIEGDFIDVYNGAGSINSPTLMYTPQLIDEYRDTTDDLTVNLEDYNTISRTFSVDFNNKVVVLQEMVITGIPDDVRLSPAPDSSFTLEKVRDETYVLKPVGAITGSVSFFVQYDYNTTPVIFDMKVDIIGYNPQTETLYYGDQSAIIDIHPITSSGDITRQTDIYFNASSLTDPVHIVTGLGADTINGSDYRDGTFETQGGNDVFYGSKANETVILGGGDDIYYLSEGIDVAYGGRLEPSGSPQPDGTDKIVISDDFANNHTIGVELNRNIIYTIDSDPSNKTTMHDFVEYNLTNQDDVINVISTEGMNSGLEIDALEGNDKVIFQASGIVSATDANLFVSSSGGGTEVGVLNVTDFYGSSGDDIYVASDISEITFYGNNNATDNDIANYGSLSGPITYNENGRAEVSKSGGEDIIYVDEIIGTDFDDTFFANFKTIIGNDIILNGGVGSDNVNYSQSTTDLVISLLDYSKIKVTTLDGTRTDTLINIESVVGGNLNDTFKFFDSTPGGNTYQAVDGIDTADYSQVGSIRYIIDDSTRTVNTTRYDGSGNIQGTDILVSFEKILGTTGLDTFELTSDLPDDINSVGSSPQKIFIDGNGGDDVVSFTVKDPDEYINMYYTESGGDFYSDIQFEHTGGLKAQYEIRNVGTVGLTDNDDNLYIQAGDGTVDNKVAIAFKIDGSVGYDIIHVEYDNASFVASNDLMVNLLVNFEQVSMVGDGINTVVSSGNELLGASEFHYVNDKQISTNIQYDKFDSSTTIISSASFTLTDNAENKMEMTTIDGVITIEKFEQIIGTSGADIFNVNFLTTDISVTYDGSTGNNSISYASATEDISFNLGGAGSSIEVSAKDSTIKSTVDTLYNFNSIISGSGDDTFILSASDPYGIGIDGGAGYDYISYENFVDGQNIDLNLLIGLNSIEGLIGSRGSDTISTLINGDFYIDGSDGIDSVKYSAAHHAEVTYDASGVVIDKYSDPTTKSGTDTLNSIELVDLTNNGDSLSISQFENAGYNNNTFTVDMLDGSDTVTYTGGSVELSFDNQDSAGIFYVVVTKDLSKTDADRSFDNIYHNESFTLSNAHQDKVYLSASYVASGLTTMTIDAGGNSSAVDYKDEDLLSFKDTGSGQTIDLTSGGTITIAGINYTTAGFGAFEGSLGNDTILVSNPSSLLSSSNYYVSGYLGADVFDANNITGSLTLDLSKDDSSAVSTIEQVDANSLTIDSSIAIYIHDVETFNLTGAGDTEVILGEFKGYTVNLNTSSNNKVTYDYEFKYSVFINLNTDSVNVQTSAGYDILTGINSFVIDNNDSDIINIQGDFSALTAIPTYDVIDTGGGIDAILLNSFENSGGVIFTDNGSSEFDVKTVNSIGASSDLINSVKGINNFTGTEDGADVFNLASVPVGIFIIDGGSDTVEDTINYQSYAGATGLNFILSENRITDKSDNTLVTFLNIERIIGTSGDDNFIVGNSTGMSHIDAGAGVDTIDFSLSATSINVDIGTSIGTITVLNAEGVRGSLYDDTFVAGSSTSSTDVVRGNAGTDILNITYYGSTNNLTINLDVTGGSPVDGTVYNGSTLLFSFGEMERFILSAGENHFKMSSTSFFQSYEFVVDSNTNVLSIDYTNVVVTTGAGLFVDLDAMIVVKGGLIDAVSYSTSAGSYDIDNFEIIGTSSSDVFSLTGGLLVNGDGTIKGGDGSDTLLLNNAGYSNLIDLTTANKQITMTEISTGNMRNLFTDSIETIITGDGDDNFIIGNTGTELKADAGGGNNSVDFSAFTSITFDALTFTATDAGGVEYTVQNAYTVNGAAGQSIFNGTVIGNFTFICTSGSLNDTLNYQNSSIGLTFDLINSQVDKNSFTDTFSGIEVFIGSQRDDTFIVDNTYMSSRYTYRGGGGSDSINFNLTAGTAITLDAIANTIIIAGLINSATIVDFSNMYFNNNADDTLTLGGEASMFSDNAIIDAGSGTDSVTVETQGTTNNATIESVTDGIIFLFNSGKNITVLNAEGFVVNLDTVSINIDDLAVYTPVVFTGSAEISLFINNVDISHSSTDYIFNIVLNVGANSSVVTREANSSTGAAKEDFNFTLLSSITMLNQVQMIQSIEITNDRPQDKGFLVNTDGYIDHINYMSRLENPASNPNDWDIILDFRTIGSVIVSRYSNGELITDIFNGMTEDSTVEYYDSLAAFAYFDSSNLVGVHDRNIKTKVFIEGSVGVEGIMTRMDWDLQWNTVGSAETVEMFAVKNYVLTSAQDSFTLSNLSYFSATTSVWDIITSAKADLYTKDAFVNAGAGRDTLVITNPPTVANVYEFTIEAGSFNIFNKNYAAGRYLAFDNFEEVIFQGDSTNATDKVYFYLTDFKDNDVEYVEITDMSYSSVVLPSYTANSLGGYLDFTATLKSGSKEYDVILNSALGDNIAISGASSFLYQDTVSVYSAARDFNASYTFDFTNYDLSTSYDDTILFLKGDSAGTAGGFDNKHTVNLVGNASDTDVAYIQGQDIDNGTTTLDNSVNTNTNGTNRAMSLMYGDDLSTDDLSSAFILISGADYINTTDMDLRIRGTQRWTHSDFDGAITGSYNNSATMEFFLSNQTSSNFADASGTSDIRISYISGFYITDTTGLKSNVGEFIVSGFGTYNIDMYSGHANNTGLVLHTDGFIKTNTVVYYDRFTGQSNTHVNVSFVDEGDTVISAPISINLGYSALHSNNTKYAPAKLTDTRTGYGVDGITSIVQLTRYSDYVDATDFLVAYDTDTFNGSTYSEIDDRGFKIIDNNTLDANGNPSDSDTFIVSGGVIDLREVSSDPVTGAADVYKKGDGGNDGTGLIQVYNFEKFQFNGDVTNGMSVGMDTSFRYDVNHDGVVNVSGYRAGVVFNWFVIDLSHINYNEVRGTDEEMVADYSESYLDGTGGKKIFTYMGDSTVSMKSDTGYLTFSNSEGIKLNANSSADATAAVALGAEVHFNTKIVEDDWKETSSTTSSGWGASGHTAVVEIEGVGNLNSRSFIDVYVNEYLYENVYNQTYTRSGKWHIFTDNDTGKVYDFYVGESNNYIITTKTLGVSMAPGVLAPGALTTEDYLGDYTVDGDNLISDYYANASFVTELGSVTDTIYELTMIYESIGEDYQYFRVAATQYQVEHGSEDVLSYIGITDNDMYDFFNFAAEQHEAGVNFYNVDIVDMFYQQNDTEGNNTYNFTSSSYDMLYTSYQEERAQELEEQALKEQEAKEQAKQEAQEQAKQEENEEQEQKAQEDESEQEEDFALDNEDDSSLDFAADDFVDDDKDGDTSTDLSFNNDDSDSIQDQNMSNLLDDAQNTVDLDAKESIIQDINVVHEDVHNVEMVINEDNTMSYANDSNLDSSAEVDKTFDGNINNNSNNHNSV